MRRKESSESSESSDGSEDSESSESGVPPAQKISSNGHADTPQPRYRDRSHLLTSYGMTLVLLLLCVFFTWATYHQEVPVGKEGGQALADELARSAAHNVRIVVVVQPDATETEFADALTQELTARGFSVAGTVTGDPPTVRRELEARAASGAGADIIATTQTCRQWSMWDSLRQKVPAYTGIKVQAASARSGSTFLSASNLRNVADQIAVIAIIAVGMTAVIITGGIDLSVGSLIALSAVITVWLIRAWGGSGASTGALLVAPLAAIALCGVVGSFSGLMITSFRIPPFIATLAMMQVASGMAFIITQGQSIYDIPASFTWLGRGTSLATLPNAVVLMALIYAAAHILMTRTMTGRRIYAVGGNAEAARLSGVSTKRTLLFVYLLSGLTAGVGGVITVSQLKAGAPTYGVMYELYVIAAVVVGGTSLTGGEGRIAGTLVGAFIIAVIRNGMNLVNVEPYTQKVVLGLVILGAVLLDRLKRKGSSR
jgi:ribose transport system permease protein